MPRSFGGGGQFESHHILGSRHTKLEETQAPLGSEGANSRCSESGVLRWSRTRALPQIFFHPGCGPVRNEVHWPGLKGVPHQGRGRGLFRARGLTCEAVRTWITHYVAIWITHYVTIEWRKTSRRKKRRKIDPPRLPDRKAQAQAPQPAT
jgi:hypothetical protein